MMTGREVESYFEEHREWQSMTWDLSEFIKKVYGKNSIRVRISRYYYVDFTPLAGRPICREIKLVILYFLLNLHYKRLLPLIDFLKAVSLFIHYAGDVKPINSLGDLTMAGIEAFKNYLSLIVGKTPVLNSFLRNVRCTWHDEFHAAAWYERDIWDLRKVHMDPSRINISVPNSRINFFDIENPDNKKLFKTYMLHLIGDRNICQTSICTISYSLRAFLRRCPCSLKEIDSGKLKELLMQQKAFYRSQEKYNNMIYILEDFYRFCNLENLLPDIKINFRDFRKPRRINMQFKRLSSGVKKQIFAHLHELRPDVAMIFLTVYCTGLYLSEVCQLKTDCLLKQEGVCYIRVLKLHEQNTVNQPIPQTLFDYLSYYRDRVLKQNPGNWLFPGIKRKFISAASVEEEMRRFILNHHITDEQGNLIKFRFHSLKHDLAYRMLDDDLSLLTIQNLLHADTIESALLYSAIHEKEKRDKYFHFLEKTGRTKVLADGEEDRQILWIRERMAQILPNGYCSYPVKLGLCPHANQCLFCDNFHTTKDFLPVFYRQSAKLALFLHTLEKSGQDKRYEAALKVKKRIDYLIQQLEADHDEPSRENQRNAQ